MKLHIFNPENDLALADGSANYRAPQYAEQIAYDLATLPLWYAPVGDAVLLPGEGHCQYHDSVSAIFDIAAPYGEENRGVVTGAVPWGWSAQIKRRLKQTGVKDAALPSDEAVEAIRKLSNRQSSIEILSRLRERGVETPPLPCYFTEISDVVEYICSRERSVVKAPWSGSGKGILWGIGRVEPPMENFCKGIIRRQGGVVCEEFLDSVKEFAMEFFVSGAKVSFAGYSLFSTVKGGYSGNMLAADGEIEEILERYLSAEQIIKVKDALGEILCGMLSGTGYEGYLGVDMMIYKTETGLALNPCMELNLRMNMGLVSRIFYDRFVVSGRSGRYTVEFHKCRGEALRAHESYTKEYPLQLDNGRISKGYLNLNPVTENNNYIAYVVVE